VLSVFKKNKTNMTWIESFPAKDSEKAQEYVFFADVVGHVKEARLKRTLSQVERRCQKLVVLGSFPRGVCYE
jgi:chorismate mutase/prephenate dehydratase